MMMKHEQMVKFAYVKENKQPSYKFHHCFLTGFHSSSVRGKTISIQFHNHGKEIITNVCR